MTDKMPNRVFKKAISVAVGDKNPVVVDGSINSPLHRFVRAKKRITQTFDEIYKYLKESRQFIVDCDINDQNDGRKDLHNVDSFLSQVISINEVLKRDSMKVAFFGRTSNGKSTVVNAMLSEKILPAGIGHTTNCFLSVIGTDNDEAYMVNTGSEKQEKKSVESLQQLAHALHNEKLDSSSLLKVYWPTSRCPLLKDDVVFVDSPGIDVSPDLDSWIDNHCLDADVFVLVVNSESTINHTEKMFFHKVNSKLSKPNIFILNNRWDASADGDPEMIRLVKQQHQERTSEFLVNELKCIKAEEANDRIFFVSALETLRHRISQKRTAKHPARQQSIDEDSSFDDQEYRMGKVARRQEFEDFELKFKECISKTAITTKFKGHTSSGIYVSKEMIAIMDQILARAASQRQWCKAERQDQQDMLDFMCNKLNEVQEDIKHKILNISEEVEMQVTKAMSEEIRRLGHLVGEFDYPFHPHSGFLRNYVKELHAYIEKGLGKNLKARCSAPLLESIEEYKTEMQDEIFKLIPANACSSNIPMTPRTNFNVSYELDVPNLCSDFHGDITFKFSLGWTNLVTRFIAPRNPRLAVLLGATVRKQVVFHRKKVLSKDGNVKVQVKRNMMCFQQSHTMSAPSQKSLTAPASSQMTLQQMEDEEIEAVKKKKKELHNTLTSKIRQLTPSSYRENEMLQPVSRYDEDELTVQVIQGISSLGSTTAMGFVVAASLVWRTLGWKLIAATCCCYSTIYLYERAMWTNAAKEKAFKRQFVDYASDKLQLIIGFTSKGCSHQIQQELSTTFVHLVSQVDTAKEKIKERITELDEEIQQLEQIETRAKLFKNKASWLERDLNLFAKEFNLSTSKL